MALQSESQQLRLKYSDIPETRYPSLSLITSRSSEYMSQEALGQAGYLRLFLQQHFLLAPGIIYQYFSTGKHFDFVSLSAAVDQALKIHMDTTKKL